MTVAMVGSSRGVGVNVFADESRKRLFEFYDDGAGRGCDLAAVDFADGDHAAIRGGDEDFVGGVEVVGAKDAFFHGHA